MFEERRQSPRYPCQARIGVIYPDGNTELLWAHDISEQGISIHADHAVPLDLRLRIVIFSYNAELRKQVQIIAQARVCYCVFDSAESDFRIGLHLESFENPRSEAYFRAELQRLAQTISAPEENREPLLVTEKPTSFPLHRRIKLALNDGRILPGWTEEVSLDNMRASFSLRLPINSVHGINMPIILPTVHEIQAVRAKARITDVVFRPMGSFATNFHVFDYEGNGRELLKEELRQRFPENWMEQTMSHRLRTDEGEPSLDTEALQPLTTKRKPRG